MTPPPDTRTPLRVARELAGLTGAALAERLGVSRSHLCKIELGRAVPSDALTTAINAALGTNLTWADPATGSIDVIPSMAEAIRQTVECLPDMDPERRQRITTLLAGAGRPATPEQVAS